MARPSNAQIEGEITEAIEKAAHDLWTEISDRYKQAHSVRISKPADRKVRAEFAAREVLLGFLMEELNDRTSDLIPKITDVKELLK